MPSISTLYRRHPGVTRSIAQGYAEALSVSLARHGTPPCELEARVNDGVDRLRLDWRLPEPKVLRAWANEIDTTEAAAYGVALGVIERQLGLVAVARARSLTGADYYVSPRGAGFGLEAASKLEVSGIDSGAPREIRARLHAKLKQVVAYGTPARAFACVVAFRALLVLLREA